MSRARRLRGASVGSLLGRGRLPWDGCQDQVADSKRQHLPQRIRAGRPCAEWAGAEWAGAHWARPPQGQQVALPEIFTPLMVRPELITVVVFGPTQSVPALLRR